MRYAGSVWGILYLAWVLCLSPEAAAQTPADMEAAPFPALAPGPEMTLAEVLQGVSARNLTLQSAALEIDKAKAMHKKSLAWVTPFVEARLEYTRMDHSDALDLNGPIQDMMGSLMPGLSVPPMDEMIINRRDKLMGSFTIGVPLVRPEGWSTIAAAKRGVAVAEEAIAAAQHTLLSQAASIYLHALSAKAFIEMQETQVRAAEAQWREASLKHQHGEGLRIDVVRAQTDVELARHTLANAHLMMENAREALRMLLGDEALPMPVGPKAYERSELPQEDAQIEAARRQRPDVRVSQGRIEVAEKLLRAVKLRFVPTLDAAWRFQYEFTEPVDLGSNDRSRWALLFSLAVPLYEQSRYGDLHYQRAVLKQAQLEAADREVQLAAEVRLARRDYLASLTDLDAAERQLQLAAEAVSLMEAAFRDGAGTSLDVTVARRDHMAASANVLVHRVTSQTRFIELLRVTGEMNPEALP
ncbi:MAG: TolC family protein [Myxococcales bacterium]|nr:TolC family protein [Myxococcales bacterium]